MQTNEKATSIYALIDPVTSQARYVGKTIKSVRDRLRVHVANAKAYRNKSHSAAWIRSLLGNGLTPDTITLQVVPKGGDWVEAEQHWIAYLRAIGARLTNHTTGGDGHPGHHPSDAVREKIGAAHRGKTISLEQRKKISAAHAGKRQSLETRRKISLAGIGRAVTRETRAKISAAKANRPQPKTSGAKNGRAVIGPAQVAQMRSSSLSYSGMASAFGISKTQVARIVRREQWANV